MIETQLPHFFSCPEKQFCVFVGLSDWSCIPVGFGPYTVYTLVGQSAMESRPRGQHSIMAHMQNRKCISRQVSYSTGGGGVLKCI
jgi:hypothetical protein